jgi:hypothetical protein
MDKETAHDTKVSTTTAEPSDSCRDAVAGFSHHLGRMIILCRVTGFLLTLPRIGITRC